MMIPVGEPTGWKNGGNPSSLCNRLSGKAGIDAFARILFERLEADRYIGRRFAASNPDSQRHNFALVLRALTGATDDEACAVAPQIDTILEHTHAGLFVTDREFNTFVFYAGVAAGALAIRQPQLGELIDVMQSVKSLIVTGPTLQSNR